LLAEVLDLEAAGAFVVSLDGARSWFPHAIARPGESG
jgi:hypothetical protein